MESHDPDRRWIQFHSNEDKICKNYSTTCRPLGATVWLPTPRFCHVKDVRSGHRAILKKGAFGAVELVGFWVVVEFSGWVL